jgi:hypothetical protein
VSFPGKGNEGSENGVFEDPLCSSLEIHPRPLGPCHADESPRPHGQLDASVRARPVRVDTNCCRADAPRPHGREVTSARMGAAVRTDAPRPHGWVLASAGTGPCVHADAANFPAR